MWGTGYRSGAVSSPHSRADPIPDVRPGIEEMLETVALEIVVTPSPGFCNRLFLVLKATGGWRPVIGLFPLNRSVLLTRFKMDAIASVLASVGEDDYMPSIDLKVAYFQIPIHQASRRFLRFVTGGVVCQFRVWCFGLATPSQVCTGVLGPGFGLVLLSGDPSPATPGRLACSWLLPSTSVARGWFSSLGRGPLVAEFLTHLRYDGLLPFSAVKGFRSALSSVFAGRSFVLASSYAFSLLLRGFEVSCPPRVVSPTEWVGSLVLRGLSGAPVEPLAQIY